MKSLRRLSPALVTLIVLGIMGWFLSRNADYIIAQYSLHPGSLVLVALLTISIFFVRSVANRSFFQIFEVKASVPEWFSLMLVTTMSNYLPMSAGLVAKGVILKKIYRLSYNRYAIGQVLLFVLFLVSNGLIGLFVLNVVLQKWGEWIIQAALLAMTGAAVIVLYPRYFIGLFKRRWQIEDETLAQVHHLAFPIMALQALVLIFLAGKLYICFQLGGQDVPFMACLLFNAAAIMTKLFSVTPGSIGLRELMIGGLAELTGFGMRDAIIAATIDRVVEVLLVFTFGSLLSWRLMKKMNNQQLAPAENREEESG